ncbi:hypothetical protein Fmac_015122 [Flemingia macrophylla]|uniref:Uncharacterized protein n=1 Tax=Flemingia macrophylla TaxID=520843 RepID=A0ABD1MDQ0_9FABA
MKTPIKKGSTAPIIIWTSIIYRVYFLSTAPAGSNEYHRRDTDSSKGRSGYPEPKVSWSDHNIVTMKTHMTLCILHEHISWLIDRYMLWETEKLHAKEFNCGVYERDEVGEEHVTKMKKSWDFIITYEGQCEKFEDTKSMELKGEGGTTVDYGARLRVSKMNGECIWPSIVLCGSSFYMITVGEQPLVKEVHVEIGYQ